ASGAPDDPYGFKPTDLIVAPDGALIVTDWADGQRPKRGRGRIYRIAPDGGTKPVPADAPEPGLDALMARLASERASQRSSAQAAIERRGDAGTTVLRAAIHDRRLGVRGRLHAVWILSNSVGDAAIPELLDLAASDPEPRVRAQAIRALANLTDP